MAAINLHGARHDLSHLKIRLNRFETFCSIELTVGYDNVLLFLDSDYADEAKTLIDIINDALDRVLSKSVPV